MLTFIYISQLLYFCFNLKSNFSFLYNTHIGTLSSYARVVSSEVLTIKTRTTFCLSQGYYVTYFHISVHKFITNKQIQPTTFHKIILKNFIRM